MPAKFIIKHKPGNPYPFYLMHYVGDSLLIKRSLVSERRRLQHNLCQSIINYCKAHPKKAFVTTQTPTGVKVTRVRYKKPKL